MHSLDTTTVSGYLSGMPFFSHSCILEIGQISWTANLSAFSLQKP